MRAFGNGIDAIVCGQGKRELATVYFFQAAFDRHLESGRCGRGVADIDVDAEKHVSPWNLSTHSDHRLAIRYIGLSYGNLKANVAANNGVYEGIDMVKMILAGATAVESVSTFYHNGVGYAKEMLKELEEWMDRKGYEKIEAFRGKLSSKSINDPFVYKRAQYIDMLLKSDDHFHAVI